MNVMLRMLKFAAVATILVVVAILALVIRTQYQVAEIERTWPPLGSFVQAGDTRLHVVRKGAGRPVVLLHGASSNLREWSASLLDPVAEKHEAIAIDRPGHGYSERGPADAHDPRVQARIIHAALTQMGIERPILVGHSWAGTVVLAYAMAYPENTAGVLFLAGVSHPWPGGPGRHHELGATTVIGPLLAHTVVPGIFAQRLDTVLECVYGPNRVPEGYRDRAGVLLASRPANFLANARDVALLKPIVADMAPAYETISAPLIVMTGDADCVLLEELHSPPLAAKVPGAELRTLNNTGHMPHHAQPDAVLTAIDDLVRRSDLEASDRLLETTVTQ